MRKIIRALYISIIKTAVKIIMKNKQEKKLNQYVYCRISSVVEQ